MSSSLSFGIFFKGGKNRKKCKIQGLFNLFFYRMEKMSEMKKQLLFFHYFGSFSSFRSIGSFVSFGFLRFFGFLVFRVFLVFWADFRPTLGLLILQVFWSFGSFQSFAIFLLYTLLSCCKYFVSQNIRLQSFASFIFSHFPFFEKCIFFIFLIPNFSDPLIENSLLNSPGGTHWFECSLLPYPIASTRFSAPGGSLFFQ